MSVFDQEWEVSDLAPVWHFVGKKGEHYSSGFLAADYSEVVAQHWEVVQG